MMSLMNYEDGKMEGLMKKKGEFGKRKAKLGGSSIVLMREQRAKVPGNLVGLGLPHTLE